MASTYVNAFVHAGLGSDALMNPPKKEEKDSPWIYKVKDEGYIAAAGSIGLINLWDQENGTKKITDYLEVKDGYLKSGACIAVGLYNMGIKDECDPAKALLEEILNAKDN